MSMSWQVRLAKALQVASECARDAGKFVLHEMHSLRPEDVAQKAPRDLVTRVDRASEEMILGRLRKEFPDDMMLCEESGGGSPQDEHLWIVDPLDGTRNFVHRYPFFCVSIAHAVNGRVEVGAIYDPTHDELFACKRDEGVWLNGAPIGVSTCADFGQAFVCTGFPARFQSEMDEYLKQFSAVARAAAGIRRSGSAALDLAYVACGRFDAYFEPRLAPWDMAAGGLLVEVAGGTVTDLDGRPWSLDGGGILAANADLHAPLLTVLRTASAAVPVAN